MKSEKEKSLIAADIVFFKLRIKQYEELTKIEHNENWWNEDMNIKQLCEYFNRNDIIVRKAIKKMYDSWLGEYKFLIANKVVILVKMLNEFARMYLKLLENYKME